MDDSRSLSLVKVRVALSLMESKSIIKNGEFSAERIVGGEIEHIREVVVKLALFPSSLKRGESLQTADNGSTIHGEIVTEIW